ncbi:hypothetical protein ETD86_46205 [Nonomuraea turkmeniaca]|uniref:Uncharacterized protein n=1 Tax=Nonomuraea turkmeniaca TaxID=103838 RepID=A0A5S4EYS7_9ACTN|nr:hypothetical protein [Nonomuraea turkmeniaca]TMR08801.1 hypothetical protein ETD86_46205 [Nonomuraea turkmeniaca]
MPNGDDLDERFNELVAQIDAEERRRMRSAATKGAKGGKKPRRDRLSSYDHQPSRRIGRTWLTMAAVTTAIGAAFLVVTFRPDLLGPSGPALQGAGALTTTLEMTAADPFAGSPAADYAEGIAGFVMPEPKAMDGLSKKDVAKGLERTRELLDAAFLDRKTLMGGEPTAFADLLDSGQRDVFYEKLGDVRLNSRTLVNSFAPNTAELATDVIKVKGTAGLDTFRMGLRHGVEVELNYLIVYAVRRPGQPSTTMRFVSHLTGGVQIYRTSGKLSLYVEWGASQTPARCDIDDGFIHPVYESDSPGGVQPTGPLMDPYRLDDRVPSNGGCRASQDT